MGAAGVEHAGDPARRRQPAGGARPAAAAAAGARDRHMSRAARALLAVLRSVPAAAYSAGPTRRSNQSGEICIAIGNGQRQMTVKCPRFFCPRCISILCNFQSGDILSRLVCYDVDIIYIIQIIHVRKSIPASHLSFSLIVHLSVRASQ